MTVINGKAFGTEAAEPRAPRQKSERRTRRPLTLDYVNALIANTGGAHLVCFDCGIRSNDVFAPVFITRWIRRHRDHETRAFGLRWTQMGGRYKGRTL